LLESNDFIDQVTLSEKMGVSKSQISESLRYGKLPDEIKEYLLENNIRTRRTLRFLLQCSSVESMKRFLGMEKREITTGKRRFIANIFVKNGQVECDLNSFNLSVEQKRHLKEVLLNIIESLDN
jgi:hypothetical protein